MGILIILTSAKLCRYLLRRSHTVFNIFTVPVLINIATTLSYVVTVNIHVPFIADNPPVITVHPVDVVIQLCTNFTNHTLTCEADGVSSYNWERRNGTIPSDSTGVNTNTLTLINLQPEDAGNYRCVATNASGSNESNYAVVTISSESVHIHV